MTYPDEQRFQQLWAEAAPTLHAPRPGPADETARIELWREQEWHNWFRWCICRKGFDWSKPGVILLLAAGFAWLISYGVSTGHWFVTAGGVVAWFTVVNLGFFIYFGLTLPGPPLAVPGPVPAGMTLRAEMGLYPPGYERRKLARAWVRIHADVGPAHRFELAFLSMPEKLQALLTRQASWRMQQGDAPLTRAVVETMGVGRNEIDSGQHPLRVVAWVWDAKLRVQFNRRSD